MDLENNNNNNTLTEPLLVPQDPSTAAESSTIDDSSPAADEPTTLAVPSSSSPSSPSPSNEEERAIEPSSASNNNESNINNNNSSSNIRNMSLSFLAAVAMATTPMFLFGYNTGVLNAPESVIFPGHALFQWSLAVSGFCIGGFFGANISGWLADQWGRRRGLLIIFWLNFIAGLMHVLTPTMSILIEARILIGVAGGSATVFTPMYLSEISPKEIRGTIGTLTQLSCVVGILASILWELPFDSEEKWRFIFVPLPAMALVGIIIGPCVLLESPSWLLMRQREQEARDNLRRLRGSTGDNDDDDVIEMMIREETSASQHQPAQSTPNPDTFDDETNEQYPLEETDSPTSSGQMSFGSFVKDPKNRIPLISSILFPVAQQLSGINAVFYYSTSLFEGVISNPQTGTIFAFTVNAVATVVAVLLMDRFGRKTLLSVSAGGMFACCILLTLSLQGILPGMLTVVGVMLYITFFELGLGCIPFFLSSEMIESEFLGRVQSISMSCNWFSNFCVGMLFPYMDRYLGPYSFAPFATVLFGTVLYSLFVLPESRGKTPKEVMEELQLRRRGQHQPVPVVESEASNREVETVFV